MEVEVLTELYLIKDIFKLREKVDFFEYLVNFEILLFKNFQLN